MKKLTAFLTALLLVFTLVSCGKTEKEGGKTDEKTEIPDKKTVIMVAPKELYPEDYQIAKDLEKQYKGKVEVREYKDSRVLTPGDSDVIKQAEKAASDENTGAVIFARATAFTLEAIKRIKKANPDIVTAAIEPEDNLTQIGDYSDFVLAADWEKYAADIVNCAKEEKCEYFLFLSYQRHTGSNPLYAHLITYFTDNCENQGIKYVYAAIDDPAYNPPENAERNIRQVINKLKVDGEIKGDNIAVFSTCFNAQKYLAAVAGSEGYTYICPGFPTAYGGAGDKYEIKYAPAGEYKNSLASAITADSENKGHFWFYNGSLEEIMLKGALLTVFDYLSAGGSTDEEITQSAINHLTEVAGDSAGFTAEIMFSDELCVECYLPGFEKTV